MENMDMQNDILNELSVCRICFKNLAESEFINLFSETRESKDILDTIVSCFRIIFTPEKHLPYKMCVTCIEDLKTANNFRLKCITAKERLKIFYENKSSEILDEHSYSDVDHVEETLFIFKNDPFKDDVKTNLVPNKTVNVLRINRNSNSKSIGRLNRRYNCTNCNYSTPHSQTLVNHMRRHNGDRPFSCKCGKNFTQMSSLTAHQKTHSKSTYFTCQQCGKQFKHSFSLKVHQRVHKDGQFTCSLCKKVLKSKDSLKAHMKRHYKVYNYSCEECGHTFVTSAELCNHKLKHVSNKSIKCNICGYSTNSKKSLQLHLKRHNGDKTYKCNYCDKTFYTQTDTKRHTRVHTREKPYACHTCAQKFAYSSSLNKHMLAVHGVHFKWGDTKWKESRNVEAVNQT